MLKLNVSIVGGPWFYSIQKKFNRVIICVYLDIVDTFQILYFNDNILEKCYPNNVCMPVVPFKLRGSNILREKSLIQNWH